MNANTLLEAHLRWVSYLPEGWRPIYRRAAQALAEEAPVASVIDAKEKMGELRISIRDGNAEAMQIKLIACLASRQICQECGGRGRLSSNQFIYATLCEAHMIDRFGSRYEPIEDIAMVSCAAQGNELVWLESLEEQAVRERPELLASFLNDQR